MVQIGAGQISEAANTRNTGDVKVFYSPSKDEPILRIIPVVEFDYQYATDPQNLSPKRLVVAYEARTMWFNKDVLAKVAVSNDNELDENTSSRLSLPIIDHSDPDIDPGTYIMRHPEVLDTAIVPVLPQKYGKGPMKYEHTRIIVCYKYSESKDASGRIVERVLTPGVFIFSQESIWKGFDTTVKSSVSAKPFTNRIWTITRDDSQQTTYTVSRDDIYDGELEPININPFNFVPLLTRKEQVEALAKFGINVPADVPETKKKRVQEEDAAIAKFVALSMEPVFEEEDEADVEETTEEEEKDDK